MSQYRANKASVDVDKRELCAKVKYFHIPPNNRLLYNADLLCEKNL